MIRRSGASLLALPFLLLPAVALAQTAPAAGPATGNAVSPRDPGAASTGVADGDRARTAGTVDGIDRHLLQQEKDRPRLPNQAPTTSQTLPGGTASGRPR